MKAMMILALAIALPQDTTTVEVPVTVEVPAPIVRIAPDSIFVTSSVQVYTDSLRMAVDRLAAAIHAQGSAPSGESDATRWAKRGAFLLVGVAIGYWWRSRRDSDDTRTEHVYVREGDEHDHWVPPGHRKKGG